MDSCGPLQLQLINSANVLTIAVTEPGPLNSFGSKLVANGNLRKCLTVTLGLCNVLPYATEIVRLTCLQNENEIAPKSFTFQNVK